MFIILWLPAGKSILIHAAKSKLNGNARILKGELDGENAPKIG